MTDAERLVLTLTAELALMTDGYSTLAEIRDKRHELRKAMDAMRAEPTYWRRNFAKDWATTEALGLTEAKDV